MGSAPCFCLLFFGFITARLDNVGKHLLDLLERELLRQLHKIWLNRKCDKVLNGACLLKINLLNFQVVEGIGQRLQRNQFTGANILLSLGSRQLAWAFQHFHRVLQRYSSQSQAMSLC